MRRRTAAIVTVGTELTEGLRLDTNTAEIAAALAGTDLRLVEAVSLPDDVAIVCDALERLCDGHALVIVTGGLGPTHDDVTREAAACALGVTLERDPRLEQLLATVQRRHTDPDAAAQVLSQADVLPGAEIIEPTAGTAPGLIVRTATGRLALLPGPPHEMRPMLARVLEEHVADRAPAQTLGVAGMTESDAQMLAQRILASYPRVGLTVLASPANVNVVLVDEGAGDIGVAAAAQAIASELGDRCYATDGSTLAEAVVRRAAGRGRVLALGESCTGGLVAAALTSVPGASDVFAGGVVAYANDAKRRLLDVSGATLTTHGAVSAEVAEEMAAGALRTFDADVAVSTTGIAGPSGGTPEKPVGLVWFGVACADGVRSESRRFPGDRAGVRERATVAALDLLRKGIAE